MPLNHVRRGTGEPVVLIHGLGSFHRVWEPLLEPLAAERDVIAIDLPGHGASSPLPPGTAPSVSALTDAVASFIDEIGVERPLVVGNSLGGWIALELAKRSIPRAVVANSPAGFWSTAEALWMRAQFRIGIFTGRHLPALNERLVKSERARRISYAVWFGHPERIPLPEAEAASRNFVTSPGLELTLAAMSRERFSGGSSVQGPVTVVWGDLDRLLFPRQAQRALAQIPQARLVRLADGGHVPTWDVPDELVRLVLAA